MNQMHFAVVVGITRYPGIKDLDAPIRDAEEFRDWLINPTGGQVPENQIMMITTTDEATGVTDVHKATPIKREIDDALEIINDRVKAATAQEADRWKETRLYLYVAGHGIMPSGGETALLMADARPGRYENLELGNYVKWYRGCGIFHELVVFADCCRQHFRTVEPSTVGFDLCIHPAAEVRTLVGYAAGGGRPAYEETEETVPPDDRRGYFTRALVEGLRKARKDPVHGVITAVTLAEYVVPAVEEATRDRPFPQRAQMPCDPGRAMAFGPGAPSQTCAVTINFPQGWTGGPLELLLQDGTRAFHDPTTGQWRVSLPPGAYGVVLPGTYDGSPFRANGLFMAFGDAHDVQL